MITYVQKTPKGLWNLKKAKNILQKRGTENAQRALKLDGNDNTSNKAFGTENAQRALKHLKLGGDVKVAKYRKRPKGFETKPTENTTDKTRVQKTPKGLWNSQYLYTVDGYESTENAQRALKQYRQLKDKALQ